MLNSTSKNSGEIFKPKAEKEKSPEKNKEQLLQEFKISLEKYGVEGVECRLEQGRLVIEQTLGAGIRGLGYDEKAQSLWLCLDQLDPEKIRENQRWNANTILDSRAELPGVTIERIDGKRVKITIAPEHPAASLARLTGKEEAVHLPGQFNGWKLASPFGLNEKTGGLENEIEWDGEPAECKVAISGVPCQWEDGGWKDEAEQKLEAGLS